MNIRIIPKLDIKNQNLVKGVSLEGLRVLGNPRDFVEKYYKEGADEIIYHDVVASLYQRNSLSSLIKSTSKNIFLPMLAGGGIKNTKQVENILNSGADRVFLNTAALDNPSIIDEIVKKYGSSTLVVSIEVVNSEEKYICRKDFGREETNKELINWAKEIESRGAGEIVVTSIDSDGTGEGFDLKIAEKLSKNLSIPFIINGGISSIKHIDELIKVSTPSGFAIGSALHYGNLDTNFVKPENSDGNVDFLKKKQNYKNFKKLSIKDIKDYLKKQIIKK